MRSVARLETTAFEPERELKAFAEAFYRVGAVASFIGIARPETKEGTRLVRLFLEHHPCLTVPSLEAIGHEAAERFSVHATLIVHRCGELLPGQPIVLAAAASEHRRAALDAVDYMMDRLKTDAVFWKREDGVDGSRWIEPTEADYRDRARWSDECRD